MKDTKDFFDKFEHRSGGWSGTASEPQDIVTGGAWRPPTAPPLGKSNRVHGRGSSEGASVGGWERSPRPWPSWMSNHPRMRSGKRRRICSRICSRILSIMLTGWPGTMPDAQPPLWPSRRQKPGPAVVGRVARFWAGRRQHNISRQSRPPAAKAPRPPETGFLRANERLGVAFLFSCPEPGAAGAAASAPRFLPGCGGTPEALPSRRRLVCRPGKVPGCPGPPPTNAGRIRRS